MLVQCGLLQTDGGRLVPTDRLQELKQLDEEDALRTLITVLLSSESPVWLRVATASGDVAEEYIPEHDLERLTSLLPDQAVREAALLAAAQTFDPSALARIGEFGERAVVEAYRTEFERLGRPDLRDDVRQVSRVSDLLGYDVVTPTLLGRKWRIEVKTIGNPGPTCRFFISRNEAEVGSRDPSWRLVLCECQPDGEAKILGWSTIDAILPLLPADPIDSARGTGRWGSTQIHLPRNCLAEGLPPIH